jgi:SynChlorMet cassette radical SAM/SPASM protein ScmF
MAHVEKGIREGRPLGLRQVKLTGGEPLLHPEFRRIVEAVRDAGLNVQIETNGTLVTRELAAFLCETGCVTFIAVSLDGADRRTHEAIRGVEGAYDRTVEGVCNLTESGFRPQLICTLSRENVHQIESMIALVKELECGSLKFNFVQQIGRGIRFAREQGLEAEELIRFYRSIEKRAQESPVPVYIDMPPAFHSVGRLLRGAVCRCTVLSILSLLSGGELSLCGIGFTIPEMVYGNIETDSLAEVWRRSPGLLELRRVVPLQLGGICARCVHRDLCLGFCVAHNFSGRGVLNGPYHLCEKADRLGLFPSSREKNHRKPDTTSGL